MYEIDLDDYRLKDWDEMTQRNDHGGRLERIANYCRSCVPYPSEDRRNLDDIYYLLNTINSNHNSRGYLDPWLADLREQIRQRLRDLIRSDFGDEVLKRINP